jgi:hypothetical protein
MADQFLKLPEDDDVLILRADSREYGLPAPQTLAKWASRPSEAPCDLEYTFVGRQAAYRAGTFRKLREALTFRNSTARAAARAQWAALREAGTASQ